MYTVIFCSFFWLLINNMYTMVGFVTFKLCLSAALSEWKGMNVFIYDSEHFHLAF